MLTTKQLEEMSRVDMAMVSRDEVTDTIGINFGAELTIEKRFASYLNHVKNPYLFRHGKVTIGMKFSHGGQPLTEKLVNYFSGLRRA